MFSAAQKAASDTNKSMAAEGIFEWGGGGGAMFRSWWIWSLLDESWWQKFTVFAICILQVANCLLAGYIYSDGIFRSLPCSHFIFNEFHPYSHICVAIMPELDDEWIISDENVNAIICECNKEANLQQLTPTSTPQRWHWEHPHTILHSHYKQTGIRNAEVYTAPIIVKVWLHRAIFPFYVFASFRFFSFLFFMSFSFLVLQFSVFLVFALDASFSISKHTYTHIRHGISAPGPVALLRMGLLHMCSGHSPAT